MPLFDIGGPQYGLRDCKIATNNNDGTFGNNVDVPSVQMLRGQLQTVNAQLEGDDRITATAARGISAQITMRWGSVHLDVLEVIMGSTRQDSGSSPNGYSFVNIDNRKMPYFGIAGRAEAEEGSGNTVLFIPKAKVMEGFQIEFAYNAFAIPELTVMAVGDENFPSEDGDPVIMIPIMYETAQAATLPPYGFGA